MEKKKTALYRQFDAEGMLLYVGITELFTYRQAQHANKHWAHEIASTTSTWYDTRADALVAEADAICNENPLHNVKRRRQSKKSTTLPKPNPVVWTRALIEETVRNIEAATHMLEFVAEHGSAVTFQDHWRYLSASIYFKTALFKKRFPNGVHIESQLPCGAIVFVSIRINHRISCFSGIFATSRGMLHLLTPKGVHFFDNPEMNHGAKMTIGCAIALHSGALERIPLTRRTPGSCRHLGDPVERPVDWSQAPIDETKPERTKLTSIEDDHRKA